MRRISLAVALLGAATAAGCGGGSKSSSSSGSTVHPNWSDSALHGPAYSDFVLGVSGALQCTDCHGASLQGQGSAPSCSGCHDAPNPALHPYVSGAHCSDCHVAQATQWASSADLHAAPAADVLLNVDHNTNELLVDECLQCHSMFQRPLGIAHFVTPIDQVGSPAGTWTLLSGAADWQATRCEVCHDATSTEAGKLAKYGAILDQAFDPSYTAAASLPAPYQYVLNGSSSYVNTTITPTSSNSLGISATKICYTCHDPDDQGADPNKIVGGTDYGPQGGDSRAFVTSSHAGMTCMDCHPTHDFGPVDPATTATCLASSCHAQSQAAAPGPGVVHANHIP